MRVQLCLAAFVAASLHSNMAGGVVVVHYWMKAFIPNVHPALPGYFLKTAKNTYVLNAPDPFTLGLDKLAGTCFLTDNRSFSTDPMQSARLTVEFDIVIDGGYVHLTPTAGRQIGRVGATENVDCITGEDKQAPRSAPSSSISVSDVHAANGVSTWGIKASGANPFYTVSDTPHINVAPNIDFNVVFAYDRLSGKLQINGDCGYFPSFESYYSVNGGPVTSIVQWPPYRDSTAASLFDAGLGINTRNLPETKIDIFKYLPHDDD